jgi:hypothetical protein
MVHLSYFEKYYLLPKTASNNLKDKSEYGLTFMPLQFFSNIIVRFQLCTVTGSGQH